MSFKAFATVAVAALFGSAAGASAAPMRADFDGDGYEDLAVGAPGEAIGAGANGTGVVSVVYGSASGLLSGRDQQLLLGENTAYQGSAFGSSLAAGDFDMDGDVDLAIGAPNHRVRNPGPFYEYEREQAGAVWIFFSQGRDGLSRAGAQLITRGRVGTGMEAGDHFGSSLAAGDADCDGQTDLVVGIPDERVAGEPAAGAIAVLRNSGSGLSLTGYVLTQRDAGGKVEAGDRFGTSLALGQLNGDTCGDIAVTAPGEATGGGQRGAVNLVFGAATMPGGDEPSQQILARDLPPAATAGGMSEFGTSIATGALRGPGTSVLAVGAKRGAHGVVAHFPANAPITGPMVGRVRVHGRLPQAPAIMAVGDFNGDGSDDLAAHGVSVWAWGPREAGWSIIHGAPGAFGSKVTRLAHYAQTEAKAAAAGDFNGDGRDDFVGGVPSYDHFVQDTSPPWGGTLFRAAGAVFYWTAPRTGTFAEWPNGAFTQRGAGGVTESNDRFGAAIAG